MSSQMNRREAMQVCAGAFSGLAFASILGCSKKATTSQALSTLRMQSPWVNDAEFIGYFTALHHDWYKASGLDLQYLSGGPEIIAETVLLSRKSEIALAPIETTAKLVQDQAAPLVIVGAQYQKSPVGIVSLAKNPIPNPSALVGKRLAVPAANILSVDALLRLNKVDKNAVTIVPYQYDPTPLLKGEVDATLDFVTNVPYTIEKSGEKAASFLLYDFGFKVFNDVVVVTKDVLEKRRPDIKAWISASRRGWIENFKDPEKYPKLFMDTWFSKTGRSLDNEVFFNKAQRPLIEHQGGVFAMTKESIGENIATLAQIGVRVEATLFDTSILDEV